MIIMDSRFVDFGIMVQDEFKEIYGTPYGSFCSNMYFDVRRAFKFEDTSWQSSIARNLTKEELLSFIKSYFKRDLSDVDDAFIKNYYGMNPNEEIQKIIELYDKLDENTECAVWAWFTPG